MAFAGWVLKVDGKILPVSFIKLSSYEITPEQDQDLDPYRDTTGLLHRNVLEHEPSKIEFQLKMLRESQMIVVDGILGDGKECMAEFWNPKRHRYTSGNFYIPARTYSMYRVDADRNDILYNPQRVALIEY